MFFSSPKLLLRRTLFAAALLALPSVSSAGTPVTYT
jgi:hypothetical protein